MLRSLQKKAAEAGLLADQFQREDPTLSRIQAVEMALELLHTGDAN